MFGNADLFFLYRISNIEIGNYLLLQIQLLLHLLFKFRSFHY